MSLSASPSEAAVTPFFMHRSDGMSSEYIAAAATIATMGFQTLSSLQMHVLDAPATDVFFVDDELGTRIGELASVAAYITRS